jgi:hypothetical protein
VPYLAKYSAPEWLVLQARAQNICKSGIYCSIPLQYGENLTRRFTEISHFIFKQLSFKQILSITVGIFAALWACLTAGMVAASAAMQHTELTDVSSSSRSLFQEFIFRRAGRGRQRR